MSLSKNQPSDASSPSSAATAPLAGSTLTSVSARAPAAVAELMPRTPPLVTIGVRADEEGSTTNKAHNSNMVDKFRKDF